MLEGGAVVDCSSRNVCRHLTVCMSLPSIAFNHNVSVLILGCTVACNFSFTSCSFSVILDMQSVV